MKNELLYSCAAVSKKAAIKTSSTRLVMILAMAMLWLAPTMMNAQGEVPAGTYTGAEFIAVLNGTGTNPNTGSPNPPSNASETLFLVDPGVIVNGNFTINAAVMGGRGSLTLDGQDGATLNSGSGSHIIISTSDVTLTKFIINENARYGISVAAGAHLTNVNITYNYLKIYLPPPPPPYPFGEIIAVNNAEVIIDHNKFESIPGTRPFMSVSVNNTGPIDITNNEFYGTFDMGFYIMGSNIDILYNDFTNADFATNGIPVGGGGQINTTAVDLLNENPGMIKDDSSIDVGLGGAAFSGSSFFKVKFDISNAFGYFDPLPAAVTDLFEQLIEDGQVPIDPNGSGDLEDPPTFVLDGWSDDGGSTMSYTPTAITGPTTYVAYWAVDEIDYSTTGNGSISAENATTPGAIYVTSDKFIVPSGDQVTITITPDAGYYTSDLRVDGGKINPNLTTFDLTGSHTVSAQFLVSPIPPYVVGTKYMTLPVGYKATSTEVYDVVGTSIVSVAKVSGDAKITWNNTTKKIEIATGLPAGEYEAVFRASSTSTEQLYTFIFKLTVAENVYFIDNPEQFKGGTVMADPRYVAEEGETVTLTITPDDDYSLASIYVYRADDGQAVVLSGTGATRTFKMPKSHVEVTAVFSGGPSGIDEVAPTGFYAFGQNGTLYLNGLTPGVTWSVYNITGSLIAQGIAADVKAEIALPGRGLYIVRAGNKVVKVTN